LVFLPGAPEINRALETIKRATKDLALMLLPLHGGLQPKEQSRVFQRAPNGFTKVVLSTNVAETRYVLLGSLRVNIYVKSSLTCSA
jgi:ATP-dependent helicase HrpB